MEKASKAIYQVYLMNSVERNILVLITINLPYNKGLLINWPNNKINKTNPAKLNNCMCDPKNAFK